MVAPARAGIALPPAVPASAALLSFNANQLLHVTAANMHVPVSQESACAGVHASTGRDSWDVEVVMQAKYITARAMDWKLKHAELRRQLIFSMNRSV